ncbi:RfaJ protein [Pasteurella multocida subsp. multocida OH4807]|nr:RfaJ protein [Pasteurella multocida subsp. multocida OH4807]
MLYKNMNIVFNADNNYAPYLAIAILSIIKTNTAPINFYVLDLGINEISKNKIKEIVHSSRNNVEFIIIKENELKGPPQTIDYIPPITYARLKIADYLPENIEKIIYLDTDILVNESLQSLWETKLQDNWIAACFDPFIEYNKKDYKSKIGLSSNQHYVNAGVLLINLSKWRSSNIWRKSINFFKDFPAAEYQDQDIINFLFKGKILYIDNRYNFSINHKNRIKRKIKNHNITLHPLEKTTMPVAIFHYVGPTKPWHSTCTMSKVNKFQQLFSEIENPPIEWIKKIQLQNTKQHILSIVRDLKDKYFYKIY